MKKKELKRQITEHQNEIIYLQSKVRTIEDNSPNSLWAVLSRKKIELLENQVKELEQSNKKLTEDLEWVTNENHKFANSTDGYKTKIKELEDLLKFWQEKSDRRLDQIKELESQLLEAENTKPTYITPIEALEQIRGLEKPNPTVGGPGSCINKSAE
jgi:predicted  nucleic acid-binding Zn-ribbon protein